jgi:hypothetical protein
MNTTGKTKTNEIAQLITLLKNNRGLNDVQAISFVAGLAYSFLSEKDTNEVFTIASKNVSS